MRELATESGPPIAGPRSLGAVNALAAGAWTDIREIIAPTEATPGDFVFVEVRVRNIGDFGFYIGVTGRYDGVDIPFDPEYAVVDPGATLSFTSSFIMPNNDVRLDVWSFYWAEPEWYQDDSDYVDIAVALWQKLASLAVIISPEVVAWQKLASLAVIISPEVVAWQKLASLAVTITPTPYELLEETIYPYAHIYEGPHDGGTFTFKTDPFTPASWVAGRLAQACEDEVRKAGGRMLEMRVYVDKSPLLWSDWRIEVVTVPPETTGTAMPLGVAWWGVAILAVLAIALIIVITWAAKEIAGLFKRKPGLDQVKVGWAKETLIVCIQDSEEYWERTPTPVETLQEMPEEELRHYLNQIAEEEAPPAGPGLGLAIAAIGVLGLGALGIMAMARGRSEEKG